ncbi:cytochrome bd-I oxidase subunit CydX [Photorhabdus sp. P32]
MWYFAWILGTLLACSFAIIAALAFEHNEEEKAAENGEKSC